MTIVNGSLIEISVQMNWLAQQMYLVYQYQANVVPGGVTAVQLAEGWWNHVKSVHRAMSPSAVGNTWRQVIIRELNNPAGDYAVFDVPPVEQAGTRGTPSGDPMPPFTALGIRLVVGTRLTRPGQKRIPFWYEGDQASGVWGAGVVNLGLVWGALMTVPMILGAPAALAELVPIVARKDPTGFVTASQPTTGFLVNLNVTTQNSRKIGRGI